MFNTLLGFTSEIISGPLTIERKIKPDRSQISMFAEYMSMQAHRYTKLQLITSLSIYESVIIEGFVGQKC